MKLIPFQQEMNAQRRRNEANLRVVQQYFSSYGKLNDDHSLEQVAPGLATLEFLKKNCPEGTKLEDFCMQAGQYFEYELYQFGDIIFNYGENGNKVYIILKGEVGVLVPRSESEIEADLEEVSQQKQPFDYEQCWKNKKPLKQMQVELLLAQKNFSTYFKNNVCQYKKVYQFYSGQSFGDVALISDKPRTASILVVSDCIHLISLSKKNFKMLCEKSVQEMNQTMEYFLRIFPNVGRLQITKFIQFFHKVEFAPQQILWKEGDSVKFFLLIQKGRIEVKQLQMLLYQVQDNALIGHEEILEGMPLRQYTCKTLDITSAYIMDQEDFNSARKNAPDIVKILCEKAQLMSFYLNQRKEEIKRGIIHIEPLQLPVERRLVKDMFVATSPRNNEIRSSLPKSLSYFDITKFNKQKSKPKVSNPQVSISEDLFLFKEKPIRVCKSPTNQNTPISTINKQIKDILMKKFKLQYKFNSVTSLKISSCSSLFDSSMKSRFKTDASIDN